MRLFGRQDELIRLESWITGHRSFMFYGPAGVGKTRLLDELAPRLNTVVRISACTTPQALFQEMALALWNQKQSEFRRRYRSVDRLKDVTAVSLKGLCLRALKSAKYTLILEHIGFTSQQLASTVKQMAFEAELSLIFVARSAHMEDAGHLVRHFPDRSERFELDDFDSERAEEFARLVADETRLTAENLTDFLGKVTELSGGNPGAIVSMIRMARVPKYRSGEWIKSTPLYIDFRLARNASA